MCHHRSLHRIDCLTIGSGLTYTRTGKKVTIGGPKIAGTQQENPVPSSFFETLSFGSGLIVTGSDCNWTVEASGVGGGMQIGSAGCPSYCGGTGECRDVECIVFGTGLCVNDNVVSGPILDGTSSDGTPQYDRGFYRLSFGTGLALEETGECWYTVNSSGSNITVTSDGCDRPSYSESNIHTLAFRSGIRAITNNGVATIDVFQKWRSTASAASISQRIDSVGCPAGPFECIAIGTGLSMEDEGDCEAIISWNGLDYRVSGCEADPNISSALNRARSICFGSGFGTMQQTNTPAGSRLDLGLTAGPAWYNGNDYLCDSYQEPAGGDCMFRYRNERFRRSSSNWPRYRYYLSGPQCS